MEEKWDTVFNQALKKKKKKKKTRRRYKRAGGENLSLDPWYVLVHGMGPYKVGQPYRGRG